MMDLENRKLSTFLDVKDFLILLISTSGSQFSKKITNLREAGRVLARADKIVLSYPSTSILMIPLLKPPEINDENKFLKIVIEFLTSTFFIL